MPKTHNLFLVNHPLGQNRRDFDEIGEKITALAPSIDVHVVPHDAEAAACGLPPDVWSRPSLAVAFRWPEKFRTRRGPIYAGRPINKFVQAQKYAAARVPIPRTLAYEFGRPLNRGFWGDYVIMKPTRIDMQSHGDHIFLMRTERVAALAPRIFPAEHPARKQPVLIQQFIDTGDYPQSFRVLTLFGEPLYCMIFRQDRPRSALTGTDSELLSLPVASNAGDNYVHQLIDDPEIVAFARRAAAAMPAIPLQGIDIVRQAGTGRLFVLENNSGGNTWHFSSRMFEMGNKKISRDMRIAQFGAWDIAAKVMVERTLREAR
ncbi:MAG: hypothetical protein K8R18_04370 [Parvibaculum sp.]|uniref:hypothetical protein n=1 Tax=Parvibaculum sp. TaxID=2024848 RepID=UPI0025D36E16|nr:hypothetical protein [Parvibaculum sp.]MCE9648843.1 hypothetical protein [Parvibaculum sp.]